MIQQHKYSGLRGYKKLHFWLVDLSADMKRHRMNMIMNPAPAKADVELAAAIEKWDQAVRS